jgi:hypothetical protein
MPVCEWMIAPADVGSECRMYRYLGHQRRAMQRLGHCFALDFPAKGYAWVQSA